MVTYSESYARVIPRDLFNESKLLKCLGQMALFHLNGVDNGRQAWPRGMELQHDTEAFAVRQRQIDGALVCENVVLTSNGCEIPLFTRYNSRDPYPLFCENGHGEEIDVLDDAGNFTADFLSFASN